MTIEQFANRAVYWFGVIWRRRPFVLRRNYDALCTENYTLRDALRGANFELRKHRTLIAGLRDGHRQTTEAVERIISRG